MWKLSDSLAFCLTTESLVVNIIAMGMPIDTIVELKKIAP